MLARPSTYDSSPVAAPGEGRSRVLVADDSLEMAQSVAEGLCERGYDAIPVGSGYEALDLLAESSFDALITDLRMPGIDGLALMARSRTLDPNRPVIAMTAYSSLDLALESLRQGAYYYVTKPFKQEELAIFLERALEQARMKRELRKSPDAGTTTDR
jgi:two-component system response regulator HydG